MKQNGSLCSVIVGNLVAVSLATQTWFLTEDAERRRCQTAAVTTLISNGNGGDFVFSSLLRWPLGRCDHGNARRLQQNPVNVCCQRTETPF